MEKIKRFLVGGKGYLQTFADNPPADPPTDPSNDPPADPPKDKTFTQEDLDKILTKRLAKEKSKWETELEEQKKKDAMTAEERLKAEKDELLKQNKTLLTQANERIKTAEAKALASDLGVKPEKVNYLLKLAELDSVEVSEGGEVDQDALKTAIESVLNDLPELKGQTIPSGGGDFSGGGGSKFLTMDQIKAMSPQEINANYELVQRSLKRK